MKQVFSRRSFLKGLVIGSIPSGYLTYSFIAPTKELTTEEKLIGFIKNESSISSSAGERYIANNTDINIKHSNTLVQLLTPIISDDKKTILYQLSKRILQDFKEDKLCKVEGWTLSITECQLSALAHLTQSKTTIPNTQPLNTIDKPKTFTELPEVEFATIEGWGPKQGKVEESFNKQPNGNSSIWLKVIGLERGNDYKLFFGNTIMGTTIHYHKNLITADLSPKETVHETASVGKRAIFLVDAGLRKQLIGYYNISGQKTLQEEALTAIKSGSLVTLENWGPKTGKHGKPFNAQPNGYSALWLKFTERNGQAYQLYYGSEAMATTLHEQKNLITASISPEALKRASKNTPKPKIYLVDTEKKKKQLIGYFTINMR
jgi:hypothetical protein